MCGVIHFSGQTIVFFLARRDYSVSCLISTEHVLFSVQIAFSLWPARYPCSSAVTQKLPCSYTVNSQPNKTRNKRKARKNNQTNSTKQTLTMTFKIEGSLAVKPSTDDEECSRITLLLHRVDPRQLTHPKYETPQTATEKTETKEMQVSCKAQQYHASIDKFHTQPAMAS